MARWTFLTNHGRALLCIAQEPDVRLRDIAVRLDITERSAYGIVSDLAEAGYILKERDGRRNRYEIQHHLPLPEALDRDQAIGDVLSVLSGNKVKSRSSKRASS
jgi:DNA-binding transcriptional ArsR family regulator